MKLRLSVLYLCLSVLIGGPLLADDWPQFRGPNRDGVSRETGLLKQWPKEGPPLAWTFSNAGLGYSGPAIVGERLYIAGARGDTEYLLALDSNSGSELWAAKIGPTFTFKGNVWGEGPRATPTVEGDAVYALGGQGLLVCVQAADGKERWRVSLPGDLGGEVNPIGGSPPKVGWGFTAAPLVDGDKVICLAGGSQGTLAALDKKTGKVLWRTKDLTDLASYASPVVTELAGVRQYVQLTDRGVAGVDPKEGNLLWYYAKKPPYNDVVIPNPLVQDNHVYVTVWAGSGCDLIKISTDGGKFNAEKVYANRNMQNRDGGVVLVNGHIYGYSEGKGWSCQDFLKGNLVWSERRKLGRGSLTYADGHLYCYSEEEGLAVLVEASPEKWTEKGRFEIPQHTKHKSPRGEVWTHPVVANGRLYLRDQELLFCYKVK